MNISFRKPQIPFKEQDNIINKIFKLRGIDNVDEFLKPTVQNLNNPYLLNNMEEVVNKVINAIITNKKIYVYSDIDADGVCACSTMYLYLKNFTQNVDYVYHQRKESHGVIINKVPKDCQLLIIVDSSTNSIDECKKINEWTDIIILDHHKSNNKNHYALIVNPQLDNYPNKSLSGSGVVFQTCRALDIKLGKKLAFNYIDIVAAGNIGDMMRVDIMENRYIAWCGLWKFRNKKCNLGLMELIKRIKKSFDITAQDISYYLVPAINAVIRLDDISKILKLLTTNDEKEAKQISKECYEINEFRKLETKRITKLIKDNGLITNDKILIIDMSSMNYKSSLNGLIATKLSRDYQKPCIVGKVKDNRFIGSARGYGDEVNLKKEFETSNLFELAQGHDASFGIEFKIKNKEKIITYFNDKFKDYFNGILVLVDFELKLEDLTYKLLQQIDNISIICGEGFERPNFLIKYINIDKNNSKTIGKENDHIKLISSNGDLEIMKFNTEEDINGYKNSDWINVVGNIGLNKWYNFAKKERIITKQVISQEIQKVNIDF